MRCKNKKTFNKWFIIWLFWIILMHAPYTGISGTVLYMKLWCLNMIILYNAPFVWSEQSCDRPNKTLYFPGKMSYPTSSEVSGFFILWYENVKMSIHGQRKNTWLKFKRFHFSLLTNLSIHRRIYGGKNGEIHKKVKRLRRFCFLELKKYSNSTFLY